MPPITFITFTKAQFPTQYELFSTETEVLKKLGLPVNLVPLNYPNPLLERGFQTRDFDMYGIGFDSSTERLDPASTSAPCSTVRT